MFRGDNGFILLVVVLLALLAIGLVGGFRLDGAGPVLNLAP
jgi:hypothetical protein